MRRRVLFAVLLVATVIVVGAAGYMAIEHWGPLDAFYMTVITVGTVGFREVHPLSAAGRLFTMGLILTGVGAIGFALVTVVDFLVEGHLGGMLEEKRMEKRLLAMNGHHIVAGMGRVGSEVARAFSAERIPFVVVEKSPDCARRAAEEGWAVVEGDATEEPVLISAGIERAASLVTALDTDAANVFVTLTARQLNPKLHIVARSTASTSEEKLRRAGADRAITPTVIGGRRMAGMVLRPFVSDYLELVAQGDGGGLRLEEITLEAASALTGMSLREARLQDRTGALVLAVRGTGGDVVANPPSDTMLRVGDRLIVMGSSGQLESLAASL